MSVLADIKELLQGWRFWKRLGPLPERMEAIEQRLTALEAKLQRAPGKECPKCGNYTFRVTHSAPVILPNRPGELTRVYQCAGTGCGFVESRREVP